MTTYRLRRGYFFFFFFLHFRVLIRIFQGKEQFKFPYWFWSPPSFILVHGQYFRCPVPLQCRLVFATTGNNIEKGATLALVGIWFNSQLHLFTLDEQKLNITTLFLRNVSYAGIFHHNLVVVVLILFWKNTCFD